MGFAMRGRDSRGSASNGRKRAFRPLNMRRLLVDMVWRAGGMTYGDAPFTMLQDSMVPQRGRTAGPMLWRRIQNTLKDVLDGRATLG